MQEICFWVNTPLSTLICKVGTDGFTSSSSKLRFALVAGPASQNAVLASEIVIVSAPSESASSFATTVTLVKTAPAGISTKLDMAL